MEIRAWTIERIRRRTPRSPTPYRGWWPRRDRGRDVSVGAARIGNGIKSGSAIAELGNLGRTTQGAFRGSGDAAPQTEQQSVRGVAAFPILRRRTLFVPEPLRAAPLPCRHQRLAVRKEAIVTNPYSSRSGREIIQPSELRRYRFVRDTRREDTYEIWRDDHLVVRSAVGFGLDRLTAQYLRREEEERETESALRSSDPLALCRLGWHRTDPGVWFRLAAGKSNDLWIYRVGPEPFDYVCTTIWSYGNAPIPCNACRRPIDPDHARLDEPGRAAS